MKRTLSIAIASLFLAYFGTPHQKLAAQVNYGFNQSYKYLKGKDAATLPATWYMPGFNDAGWLTGTAPFRYTDGTGGTNLTDMQGSYSTVYLRGTFTAANLANYDRLKFSAIFDDGFIVWINGSKTLSVYAPSVPSYNSVATNASEFGPPKIYIVDLDSVSLIDGINTIAIQGFNSSINGSDFYIDLSFISLIPVPPKVVGNPSFSHTGGFYSVPFNVTITAPGPEYQVLYTLDGSNPDNSTTRFSAGSTATVLIDPLSSVGRALTPAVVLRASVVKSGFSPSLPLSRTFIFTSEVPKQSYPGGDWPASDVGGQIIDLPMDPGIVNDPRYSSQMDFSLKAIPTISIVTDNRYLFDLDSGLYVNAWGHGPEWERLCSAELLNPDGKPGFNINAGLRIRGGYSRHDWYPKHAFRLFFNSEYGVGKLKFPLFENEGTSSFDKIDIRCEQNYSYANAGWESAHNTAVREVFSRDTQRDMGQPYARSRYYHLYLNGMYWGLYQTQERTEANFASTYLGGKDTDYDVVKVNTEDWNYVVEATDGTLDSWQNIYNLCNTGFASNTNYYKLEGKDSQGKRIEGAPVLLDIDNLIDYMLVIFYTGNFDSPTSSFGGNNGPNNYFAIYNKVLQNQGFTFYAHDAEHAVMSDVCPPGTGLYEDRVNLSMNVGGFSAFHPQWLHSKLTQNAEYRMRFADRAFKYLQPGNVLSPEACLARINARASQLDYAIIAETARWGDSKGQSPAKTKDDQWLPEIEKIRNDFIPVRSDILASQLTTAGLYPAVKPSIIKADGTDVQTESYNINSQATVAFQNPNASGTVYYTLDDSDPRLVGGAVKADALTWAPGSDFTLNHTAAVKTRVLKDGEWSALKHTNFLNLNEDYSKLKVTELMYHPKDFISGIDTVFGNSLEFIEFKNTGTMSINISGMMLDSAVHCTFPANTLLAPGQFYVVASKPGAFTSFYGFPPSANFSGNFSNGGEYVLLTDPSGNPVISFTYNDVSPWPFEADGLGFSLVSAEKNPIGDPNNYLYWKASVNYNGSPFKDAFGVGVDSNLNQDFEALVYPNPANEWINIQLKSPDYNENFKVKIYSYNGAIMYEDVMNSEKQINLKEFGIGPGVYLIRIESNKSIITRKLVVTN